MIFAGLYPFNFSPPNRVQWLANEPGLYFNGTGIAYTDRAESVCLNNALSIVFLLKERRGSKNWGPREIFSFYDGPVSPSLLLGQWDGRIFIYSRFEKNQGQKWYRIFRTKYRFHRGKTQIVTVTFNESEKAIYIDGQLRNRKKVELDNRARIEIYGSLLLGNSPRGKNGWNGEIKGLAIYDRALLPDEIITHSREILKRGVKILAKTPGCLALYPFDEGKGNSAKSIVGKPRSFTIPMSLNASGLSLISLPYKDMRFYHFSKADFLKNIVFFVFFGSLLTAIIQKKYATRYFFTFLIVTLAGGLLSSVIEGLQLFLHTRASGITDILANILGSGLGMQVSYFYIKRESVNCIKGK
jgi:VanZ family protein